MMIKSPFLTHVIMKDNRFSSKSYPFSLPPFNKNEFHLDIKKPIPIISGDNGVGKSTLLEIITTSCRFNINRGNRNYLYNGQNNDVIDIVNKINLSW